MPSELGKAAPTVGIVTGADDRHRDYLDGLLNSLRLNNDLGLPVHIFDFGFSPENRAAVLERFPGVTFLPVSRIDRDIAEMRDTPGVSTIAGISYVLSTMRKLELSEYGASDFFLWLDADTVVLRPVSTWLPEPRPGAIYAARNSRRALDFQFKDRNPLVRHALADYLLKTTGFEARVNNSFNSGVILAETRYYAELVDWARRHFLKDFGPYLMGDQAIINVAMSLRGEAVVNMHPDINVSIPAVEGPIELTTFGENRILAPVVKGRVPAVYHYLVVKPHSHPRRDHPVVTLYAWWKHAAVPPASC